MRFGTRKQKVYTLVIRFKVKDRIKVVRYCTNANRQIVIDNMNYITQNPRCISACIVEEKIKMPKEFFREMEKLK